MKSNRQKVFMEKIFVTTVFKSGTKLLENIIAKITGLQPCFPIHSSQPDYSDSHLLRLEKDSFFIWHAQANETINRITQSRFTKRVFLVRNIYDLLVSQYHHFALDVDSEIGASTLSKEYFSKLSLESGLSLVICGASSSFFHWEGFGSQLSHTENCIHASQQPKSILMIYDRLVLNKREEVVRLANFLGYNIDNKTLEEILESSSLENLRLERERNFGRALHFRKGVPGAWKEVLQSYQVDMISSLKLRYAPSLDGLCKNLNIGDVVAGI
jgi:hypothetical protein